MGSRTARLTVATLAWLAIPAASFFLIQSEKQIAVGRAGERAFDLHAREATDALAELRAAEQAYVAEGQGVAFWMPKVSTATESIGDAIRSLRNSAASSVGRSALDEAANTIVEFATIDKRARDYINAGQTLMAGDVIFTEGGTTAANAGRQVESARLAEQQALDQSEADLRREQMIVLGIGASLLAISVLLLLRGKAHTQTSAPAQPAAEPVAVPPVVNNDVVAPVLKSALALCIEFSHVRDLSDLQRMLGRVAATMDAKGLIVWLGDTAGGDLQPVLAYGYSPHVLARMPSVPRSDLNAAAAAYRTGELQIVRSHSASGDTGALVAPILSADGCIGALSAEIRGGGEASESVQALASLFASQLSTILATSPASAEAETKAAVSNL
jgi:hypothetical protein